MTVISYVDLARLVAPEIVVAVTALIVLAVDLLVLKEQDARIRLRLCAAFASAGCGVAIAWMFAFPNVAQTTWAGIEVVPLTQAVKASILCLGVLSMWVSVQSALGDHIGEYFSLLLLSALGMMLLVSSRDLLTIFVSLELSTVPLYALAAFQKRVVEGTESALKYFLFGGMSSAVTLFAFSLLYASAGSMALADLGEAAGSNAFDPLLIMGVAMTTAGLGFKIAAAPFHLWAPEVYAAAPVPSTAFISSASKVAGIFIICLIFFSIGGELLKPVPGGARVVSFTAVLSILIGTLAAVAQSDVRRLLAFSAVSHAGYMLLAVFSESTNGLPVVFYYATTYGLATLGTFTLVAIATGDSPGCSFSKLAGLHSRSPMLGACMLVFMLSLAGIPPLGGFMGKFLVFASFMKAAPLEWARIILLLLALAASAVSLYYYLRVLKNVYVLPAPADEPKLAVSIPVVIILALTVAGVVLLGVAPQLLLGAFLNWAGTANGH